MQLTRFTDFSLRTLIYLAIQPTDSRVSLQEICDHFNMPRNHLIRISQKLSQLGYVATRRGQKGGLSLARDAGDINLGRVVREMENHLDPIPCAEIDCPISNRCQLQGILERARDAFLAELDRYSLADLAKSGAYIIELLNIPRSA
jgi:Rrf2 family nitric oxide-sensitive transcriptional repressor